MLQLVGDFLTGDSKVVTVVLRHRTTPRDQEALSLHGGEIGTYPHPQVECIGTSIEDPSVTTQTTQTAGELHEKRSDSRWKNALR